MAHYVLARNLTDGPLVVSRSGRSVGGGEWAAVDAEDPTAKRLCEVGLVLHDELPEGDDLDADAQAAIAEVRERNGDGAPGPSTGGADGGSSPAVRPPGSTATKKAR